MDIKSPVPDEWQSGLRAGALADWICRADNGHGVALGADLWVWVTLDELPRFHTEVERVERLLVELADLETHSFGKGPRRPVGGNVVPAVHSPNLNGASYGAGSALARLAPATWHYVARSRATGSYQGDDLLGCGWTIAPTPAGAALNNWARAIAQPDLPAFWDRLQDRKRRWAQYKGGISGAGAWLVGF
jgi:hypothetical protein